MQPATFPLLHFCRSGTGTRDRAYSLRPRGMKPRVLCSHAFTPDGLVYRADAAFSSALASSVLS